MTPLFCSPLLRVEGKGHGGTNWYNRTGEGREIALNGGYLIKMGGNRALNLSFSTRDTQDATPEGSESPRMGPRHMLFQVGEINGTCRYIRCDLMD